MATSVLVQKQLRSDLPEIRVGDTVRVHQKVQEGDKERVSVFEGLVIAKKHGSGISATITVRKSVDGIGVERVFPIHSPGLARLEVVRRSKVRRAKLYYIREKAAREARRKMKQVWSAKETAPAGNTEAPETSEAPEAAAETSA